MRRIGAYVNGEARANCVDCVEGGKPSTAPRATARIGRGILIRGARGTRARALARVRDDVSED